MAPSNYKQVIDIFDPMPPNSSEAILTTILATGPQKQKKGKISDYIKDYQENYSVYLKDFTVIEKVLNLISNVDTLSSATIGIMVDNIEMIDQNTLEADREKMLLKVEENCAFEYHRRIKHSKLQAKISRALDALHSVMQKKLGESRLNDEDLKTLLFNLDYGASNLELERFSDSVMFSIFLNKVREYTNKKDMSLSLFENLTHEMKDALRGFMKRSLNELIKKKVFIDYTLQSPYQARNIVFSFEIDSGFLVIIATNSPSKLNICGRDEFREEEILLYEKMPDQVITEMREELKTAEEPKELK
jgi:ribosomal protein L24